MDKTTCMGLEDYEKQFDFDESLYPNHSQMTASRIRISHKAFCNKCGSDDCQIVEVMNKEKI